MALHWGIEKCRDFEELKSDKEWVITEMIIFATMFIGMFRITEENYVEFATRVHAWETTFGAMITRFGENGRESRRITVADVKRRIGLHTNASTKTKAQFIKHLGTARYDESARAMREDAASPRAQAAAAAA